jgi:hypothetical protein
VADQHQQTAARMMILGVDLEMVGEVRDAFAQDRNLDFRGAGVAVVRLERLDQIGLAFFGQCHVSFASTNGPDPRLLTRPGSAVTNFLTPPRGTCYISTMAGCKAGPGA